MILRYKKLTNLGLSNFVNLHAKTRIYNLLKELNFPTLSDNNKL